jgi:hypothetical protein
VLEIKKFSRPLAFSSLYSPIFPCRKYTGRCGLRIMVCYIRSLFISFLFNQFKQSLTKLFLLLFFRCVQNGASISSNSWGGGGYSQALYDAINAANTQGHLFIAAAGNDAKNIDVSPS